MDFSIIITTPDKDASRPCLNSLKSLEGQYSYEVILAMGQNPSAQRNEASRHAQGDYLVFLDNDSIVSPKLLHYYTDAFSYNSNIKVVGGPSSLKPDENLFSQCVQGVFESEFGMGPFRSRYISTGVVRPTSERELILCNLCVERKFFLENGGFKLDLYPNEENEFLNRIQSGQNVWYHPLAVVYRGQRKNLKKFIKQMISYGHGRARHYKKYPHILDLIFSLPVAFFIYCSFSTVLLTLEMLPRTFMYPIFLYLLFAFFASLMKAIKCGRLSMIPTMMILFYTCHFFYGLGFIMGVLFPSPKRPDGGVVVEWVMPE